MDATKTAPRESTATPRGVMNPLNGEPSSSVPAPLPAKLVTTPELVILRMVPFPLSATNRFPFPSSATADGLEKRATLPVQLVFP